MPREVASCCVVFHDLRQTLGEMPNVDDKKGDIDQDAAVPMVVPAAIAASDIPTSISTLGVDCGQSAGLIPTVKVTEFNDCYGEYNIIISSLFS